MLSEPVGQRRRPALGHVQREIISLQVVFPAFTQLSFSSRFDDGQGAKILPSFKSGVSMRFHYSILLLVLAQPVFADAYKCKPLTGQAVITERPCDNGYVSSARSDGTDSDSYRRAQADLQRQKDWLRQREAEQRGIAPVQPVYAAAPSYDRDAIYACLMKAAARLNLRPMEEARRKAYCWPGGVGLIEECKSSVAATMRLSSSEEAAAKSLCH